MFKIYNRTVQNKLTGEKFGSEKIIAQYVIRIVQRGNLAEQFGTREYMLLNIKKYHFIHFCCLFLKSSKAITVSLLR